jgi:hypothetical protein
MARSNFAEVAARAARAARRRDDKRDISSKNVRRVTEKSSNFGFRVETPRLLHRHQSGDFGCVDPYDVAQNLEAIESGEGILTQYHVMAGEKEILICVMTEADRSFTVVFVPDKTKLDLPDLPEGGGQPGSYTPCFLDH